MTSETPIQTGTSRPVAITGAGGFVGSHLVRMLCDEGLPVRAVVRKTSDAARLRAMGCEVTLADVRHATSLREAFTGCGAVVHLVAIIRERGGETFDAVNRQGTANAAAAAREAGVRRFVHMSALGAAPDASRYLRSKWEGEEEVRRVADSAVIFRPSFLIGPGGAAVQFAEIVRFGPWYPFALLGVPRTVCARLASATPIVPILGSGRYRSMPAALADVLDVLTQAVRRDDVAGRTFEIGGPEALTYNAIIDEVAAALGLRRRQLHLSQPFARAAVALFALMENPPITRDEADSLFTDNLCDNREVVRTFGLRLRPFAQAIREALAGTGTKS